MCVKRSYSLAVQRCTGSLNVADLFLGHLSTREGPDMLTADKLTLQELDDF